MAKPSEPMKLPASRVIELLAVAAAFALCGAFSGRLYPDPSRWPSPLVPVPFAVLCAVLFARHPKALLAVPLCIPVLYVAVQAAAFFAFLTPAVFDWLYAFPMCVAGFIGGAGIALSFGIVHRQLFAPKRLFGVAGIAALAAVPFGAWLRMHLLRLNVPDDPGQPLRLMCSFAVWQAGVGTYLYSLCAKPVSVVVDNHVEP